MPERIPPTCEVGILPEPARTNELHSLMVAFIYGEGWTREEEGSGWFWHQSYGEECTLGDAVQIELERHGIDTREEPKGLKSPSYWGES